MELLCEVEEYSIGKDKWTSIVDLPVKMQGAASVVMKDTLYCIEGNKSKSAHFLSLKLKGVFHSWKPVCYSLKCSIKDVMTRHAFVRNEAFICFGLCGKNKATVLFLHKDSSLSTLS